VEEHLKNKLGFWTFFFIVLFLAVGGYFLTEYLEQEPSKKKNNYNKNEQISYKIDEDKDYIYFVNEESIIDEDGAEVFYKDVIINIKGQESLTEKLEKENKIYKNNIKYLNEVELLTDEIINYNYNNIYALTFREYKLYNYNDYISLVIDDHNYSCFDLNTFIGTNSYIFNIKNGALISFEEVLDLYDVKMDTIKEKIRNHLLDGQNVVDEVELIKIDETIDNLDYSLYINEYGRLYISYLVKTTQVDYNEVMEVK